MKGIPVVITNLKKIEASIFVYIFSIVYMIHTCTSLYMFNILIDYEVLLIKVYSMYIYKTCSVKSFCSISMIFPCPQFPPPFPVIICCLCMQILCLRQNNVDNMAPISGLTTLTDLDLYDNDLAEIQGLEGLVELR